MNQVIVTAHIDEAGHVIGNHPSVGDVTSPTVCELAGRIAAHSPWDDEPISAQSVGIEFHGRFCPVGFSGAQRVLNAAFFEEPGCHVREAEFVLTRRLSGGTGLVLHKLLYDARGQVRVSSMDLGREPTEWLAKLFAGLTFTQLADVPSPLIDVWS